MLYCSVTGGFGKEFSFLWPKDLLGQEPWTEHYTPKSCTSMVQTDYIFFQFFFLSVTDGFNFLPSHKSTFIWILESGELPGLRFRYPSLLMIKRQRRKRHGKGSIFLWSTGFLRDDQKAVRCSAERVCHSSSSAWTYTWSGRVFLHSGYLWSSYQVTSLHMDFSIPTHLIMTLSSCASASACCGSLHTSSPQPGFGIDILPSTLILSKGSNTTVLLFTSSLPSF